MRMQSLHEQLHQRLVIKDPTNGPRALIEGQVIESNQTRGETA